AVSPPRKEPRPREDPGADEESPTGYCFGPMTGPSPTRMKPAGAAPPLFVQKVCAAEAWAATDARAGAVWLLCPVTVLQDNALLPVPSLIFVTMRETRPFLPGAAA